MNQNKSVAVTSHERHNPVKSPATRMFVPRIFSGEQNVNKKAPQVGEETPQSAILHEVAVYISI